MAVFHLTVSLYGHTLTIHAGPDQQPDSDQEPQSGLSPGASTETVYRAEPAELQLGFTAPSRP